MKVLSIRYKRLKNLGNYQHEEIGVEVALEDDDTPGRALRRAKEFVAKALSPDLSDDEIANLRRVVANPDDFTGRAVKMAQERLSSLSGDDDIPF